MLHATGSELMVIPEARKNSVVMKDVKYVAQNQVIVCSHNAAPNADI